MTLFHSWPGVAAIRCAATKAQDGFLTTVRRSDDEWLLPVQRATMNGRGNNIALVSAKRRYHQLAVRCRMTDMSATRAFIRSAANGWCPPFWNDPAVANATDGT